MYLAERKDAALLQMRFGSVRTLCRDGVGSFDSSAGVPLGVLTELHTYNDFTSSQVDHLNQKLHKHMDHSC